MAIWHPFIRGYRKMRARYRVRREKERLAGMKEPFFSRDHVGFKIEIWKRHLSEFAARDGHLTTTFESPAPWIASVQFKKDPRTP